MTQFLYVLLLIIELFFLAGLALYSLGLLYSGVMGAPYVPTKKKTIRAILEKAGLKKDMVFMELGSGDGRILFDAVKHFGVKGIGVEINGLLVAYSKFLARRERLEHIEIRNQNIFNANLAEADVIYMFLMPDILKRLDGVFRDRIRKGTIVISHGFRLKGWEKKQFDEMQSEPFPTFFYRF